MTPTPAASTILMKKKLTLFGTRHYIATEVPAESQNALEVIIDKRRPQIVLEEWSEAQKRESAAAHICKTKALFWKSIGTPPREEFRTYGLSDALDFPDSANIQRYGPILIQEKREKVMQENIVRSMASVDVALLVIGLAHLHSMYSKLSTDFDVEGFAFGPELL